VSLRIDIDADWNTMDDTGLPWTFVNAAADPNKIVPGAYVMLAKLHRGLLQAAHGLSSAFTFRQGCRVVLCPPVSAGLHQ
jgi:hypothetical protein